MKLHSGLRGLVSLLLGLLVLFLIFRRSLPALAKTPSQMRANQIARSLRDRLKRFSNISDFGIELLVAQARHETGNFTSAIFRESNNFFGMRHPRRRATRSIGVHREHARFQTLDDSVIDMILYLIHFRTNPGDFANVESYVRELKNDGYFEDTEENYLRAMRAHMRGSPFLLRPTNVVPLRSWKNPIILQN